MDTRISVWSCVAALVIVGLCYWAGRSSLGGALLLSGVLLGVVGVFRSGALSAGWLDGVPSGALRVAAYVELAKAFVCGGLVVDVSRVGRLVIDLVAQSRPALMIHVALLVVVMLCLVVGAGAFLTRWFAAWVAGLR